MQLYKRKKADIALRDLEFSRKRIAKDVSKTVKSAISNVENNYHYYIDNIFLKRRMFENLCFEKFRLYQKVEQVQLKNLLVG